MKQRIINIILFLMIIGLGMDRYPNHVVKKQEFKPVKLEQPEFLLSETPEDCLIQALNYYKVKHPKIVYAQAVLETGNFKSRVFKDYNNLFGLYNSSNKDYYKFNHWSESIVAYIATVQYKYKPPNDYYSFLKRIGYAEDPNYINKIKNIVNNINNDKI